MVFSSLPSYLDPPNWSQQQPTGGIGVGTVAGSGGDHELFHFPPPLPAPTPLLVSGGDGRSVQIMERGRMTKLPQPDTAMKCPRCESTNTKFCYFNNYSLSQPRHFCKTCRRYWTRGGALRNVPVGGGCRRNKKSSKGSRGSSSTTSRSKSPSTTSNNTPISPNSSSDILGHFSHTTRPPQFPILPPLHHFGGGDLSITFGGGNGNGTTHDHLMNNLGHHDDTSLYPNSKLTHFPFMYGEGPSNYGHGQVGGILKMEENHHHHDHQQQQQQQGMNNLSRNFLGISGNDQFLGTSNVAWSTTDLTGLPSSSTNTTTTTHLL